jgi:hypothetical protein
MVRSDLPSALLILHADYFYRETSPSDMVYTQARLDEALSAFRECKKFLERRGLKTANLESHLGRKYELRRPPETAFARRPTLWLLRDDDSDGEFEPSSGRKKKNALSNPKTLRLHKRKLSVSGDDSGTNKNKRRRQPKSKGTTWAQGRRVGRSEILILKFTKPENLEVLNKLIPSPGSEKMPHEEPVNVFNVNGFDSGFKVISPSDLKGVLPQHSAGTIVDPSVGLPTPRGSVGSIEALHTKIEDPFAIANLPAITDEPTRDLRNRVVSVNFVPVPFKKRYSCLTCKEEGNKCSLLKSHQDYQGACDACELADSPCRINNDDEPRIGPLDRINLEREVKRSAKEDGARDGKRRKSGNGNIGSIFDQDEDSSSGLGSSMLKRKDGKRNNPQLTNELNHGSKAGFSGRDFGRDPPPLNTSLANSSPDSGYHSSFLTSSAPKFDINMSNSVDTAISISSLSSSPDPTDSTTSRITTPWAHPINFQHQPKVTGEPCHFCQDFRYGLVGLGTTTTVEVAWDHGEKNYIEISGGHFGTGKETTRMCTACALERLRIRFCGYGHDKGKERDQGKKICTHNHTLIEMPTWRALGVTRNQQWTKQLQMKRTEAGYLAQPVMPPCHLCHTPATYRCDTVQKRNLALQPLEGTIGKHSCGLRVCDGCKDNVEGCGGQWVRGKVLGMGERADAEFLFEGAGLERSKAWGEYLESVELLQ